MENKMIDRKVFRVKGLILLAFIMAFTMFIGVRGVSYAASADNSLKSLSLSNGKLSPTFQSQQLSYKTTVGYDITNVNVVAKTSHRDAKILSITGNENLKVGENYIKVLVQAPNENKVAYTIKVTRLQEEKKDEAEKDNEVTVDDGKEEYKIDQEFDAQLVPDAFEKSTANYQGKEYTCVKHKNAEVYAFYMTQKGKNGAFYLMNPDTEKLYPLVAKSTSMEHIVFLEFPEEVSTDYTLINFKVGNDTVPSAYKESNSKEDLLYTYGVNREGNIGWYTYDTEGDVFQTTDKDLTLVMENSASTEEEAKDTSSDKPMNNIVIYIMVIVIIVLAGIVLLLMIRDKRKKKHNETVLNEIDEKQKNTEEKDLLTENVTPEEVKEKIIEKLQEVEEIEKDEKVDPLEEVPDNIDVEEMEGILAIEEEFQVIENKEDAIEKEAGQEIVEDMKKTEDIQKHLEKQKTKRVPVKNKNNPLGEIEIIDLNDL